MSDSLNICVLCFNVICILLFIKWEINKNKERKTRKAFEHKLRHESGRDPLDFDLCFKEKQVEAIIKMLKETQD